jgi:ATP-dependent Lon protease
MQTIQKAFDLFKEKAKKFPKDKAKEIKKAETPDTLIDLLVPHLALNQEKKLEFYLEEDSLLRLENLAVAVEMQNEVLDLQDNIQKRVKDKLERNQKEWFLGEQLKEIQKELGHEEEDPTGVRDLKKRIEEKQPAPGRPGENPQRNRPFQQAPTQRSRSGHPPDLRRVDRRSALERSAPKRSGILATLNTS